MNKLLIDVCKDHFKWAIKQDDQVTLRGLAYTFEELRAIETMHQSDEVWIDEGYRTDEVRTAAGRWQWNPVKGPSVMNDEIAAAVHHPAADKAIRASMAKSLADLLLVSPETHEPLGFYNVGNAPDGKLLIGLGTKSGSEFWILETRMIESSEFEVKALKRLEQLPTAHQP